MVTQPSQAPCGGCTFLGFDTDEQCLDVAAGCAEARQVGQSKDAQAGRSGRGNTRAAVSVEQRPLGWRRILARS